MTGTAPGDDWRREVLLARLRALSDDGRLRLLAHMAGSFPATLEVALTRFEREAALDKPEHTLADHDCQPPAAPAWQTVPWGEHPQPCDCGDCP